jgi:hypothetical protein
MSASRPDKTLFGRVYLKSDSVRNVVGKPIRLRVVEVTSCWAEQSVEQHARDEDSGRKQVAAMVTTDQWKRKGICYLFIQYIHTWTVNWCALLHYVVEVTPERLAQNRREGGTIKCKDLTSGERVLYIIMNVSQYLCLKKNSLFSI